MDTSEWECAMEGCHETYGPVISLNIGEPDGDFHGFHKMCGKHHKQLRDEAKKPPEERIIGFVSAADANTPGYFFIGNPKKIT